MSVLIGEPRIVCPECDAGKHYNCNNIALDEASDSIVDCPCYQRGHA